MLGVLTERLADTEHVADSSRQPGDASKRPSSFDLTLLLDLFENDRAAIVDLLRIAITAIRDDVATIGGAPPGDPAAIVEAAHRLKGTSGTIGAMRLTALAARVETLAKHRPGERLAPDVLRELHAAKQDLEADIAAYAREAAG